MKRILNKMAILLGRRPLPLNYQQSADALPPALWAQLAPYLQRQGQRFQRQSCWLAQCNICGQAGAFFYPDPLLYRESLVCAVCLTTSRYRSIARGILRAVKDLTGVEGDSLTGLSKMRLPRPLRVYDTQPPFYYHTAGYPLPDLLAATPGIEVHLSQYVTAEPLGKKLSQQRDLTNQNLEKLTFSDASFDIVITSDVMEHVRLERLAHAEIRRVLKPGGVYLFTVPHSRAQHETLQRVVVVDPDNPAKDEYPLEKEYHGDVNSADNAALSYRVYGTDLDDQLKGLGFAVDYTHEDFPDSAIMNTELFYCRLNS